MKNKILGVLVLGMTFGWNFGALAHGGGESEKMPQKPKAAPIRLAANAPDALDESELQALNRAELPHDVAVVYCKLGEFSDCRGVSISISDLAGKAVATAHTGITGTAAFKGLKANTTYIAKIDGERYEGQLGIKGGATWSMWAVRK